MELGDGDGLLEVDVSWAAEPDGEAERPRSPDSKQVGGVGDGAKVVAGALELLPDPTVSPDEDAVALSVWLRELSSLDCAF